MSLACIKNPFAHLYKKSVNYPLWYNCWKLKRKINLNYFCREKKYNYLLNPLLNVLKIFLLGCPNRCQYRHTVDNWIHQSSIFCLNMRITINFFVKISPLKVFRDILYSWKQQYFLKEIVYTTLLWETYFQTYKLLNVHHSMRLWCYRFNRPSSNTTGFIHCCKKLGSILFHNLKFYNYTKLFEFYFWKSFGVFEVKYIIMEQEFLQIHRR